MMPPPPPPAIVCGPVAVNTAIGGHSIEFALGAHEQGRCLPLMPLSAYTAQGLADAVEFDRAVRVTGRKETRECREVFEVERVEAGESPK